MRFSTLRGLGLGLCTVHVVAGVAHRFPTQHLELEPRTRIANFAGDLEDLKTTVEKMRPDIIGVPRVVDISVEEACQSGAQGPDHTADIWHLSGAGDMLDSLVKELDKGDGSPNEWYYELVKRTGVSERDAYCDMVGQDTCGGPATKDDCAEWYEKGLLAEYLIFESVRFMSAHLKRIQTDLGTKAILDEHLLYGVYEDQFGAFEPKDEVDIGLILLTIGAIMSAGLGPGVGMISALATRAVTAAGAAGRAARVMSSIQRATPVRHARSVGPAVTIAGAFMSIPGIHYPHFKQDPGVEFDRDILDGVLHEAFVIWNNNTEVMFDHMLGRGNMSMIPEAGQSHKELYETPIGGVFGSGQWLESVGSADMDNYIKWSRIFLRHQLIVQLHKYKEHEVIAWQGIDRATCEQGPELDGHKMKTLAWLGPHDVSIPGCYMLHDKKQGTRGTLKESWGGYPKGAYFPAEMSHDVLYAWIDQHDLYEETFWMILNAAQCALGEIDYSRVYERPSELVIPPCVFNFDVFRAEGKIREGELSSGLIARPVEWIVFKNKEHFGDILDERDEKYGVDCSPMAECDEDLFCTSVCG